LGTENGSEREREREREKTDRYTVHFFMCVGRENRKREREAHHLL
jgi:hypothetical protein